MTSNRTTKLRKLLDERGVEYERTEDDTTIYYDSDCNRYTYNVNQDSGRAQLFGYNLTPEQAIAVTLGSEREVELQSALYEVSDKWAQAQIEAEDYARENLLLRAKLDSATLGNGMLTAEHVEKAIRDCSTYASYDGCTYYASGIRLQAIADELNAELGSGTCHIEERNGDWYCDACGEMVGTCDPASELCIDGNAVELWNYCPNCGKKVKR